MTHHRKAGSIEDKLREVLNVLSPDEIQRATGKKVATFYAISNPTNDYVLDMDDAAAFDAALMHRGLLPVFAPIFQEMTKAALARFGGAASVEMDLMAGMCRLSKEVIELHVAASEAMAAGKLTPALRRTLARESQDVMDHAREIRDAAEPPYGTVTKLRAEG